MNIQTTEQILGNLADAYGDLSPKLRRAAEYVLNNPNEVGVKSMRQLALSASITPNTLIRMAKAIGFDRYKEFSAPFKNRLIKGTENFPDRARWLQSLSETGDHGHLFSQLAATGLGNTEQLFSNTTADELKSAADRIVSAETAYILGVGSAYSLAHIFWYVGRMAVDNLMQVPRTGNLPIDDIARIGPRDVLLAITVSPYRSEVVRSVELAVRRKAHVIAVTDSRASPMAQLATETFIIQTTTPQFFPSLSAGFELMEALLAFVVADADPEVIANIEGFHQFRYETGVYTNGK
jgi:DNA-binding MurR/RpiR family transcriptional regulator